ncbi:MAG: hypothetical protein Q9209_002117 [Squamulea sp. 1 TL-2023]
MDASVICGGLTVTLLRSGHHQELPAAPIPSADSKIEPVVDNSLSSLDSSRAKGSNAETGFTLALPSIDSQHALLPTRCGSQADDVAISPTEIPGNINSLFRMWFPSQILNLQGLGTRCNKPVNFHQPVIWTALDQSSLSKVNQFALVRHPPVVALINSVTTWKGLTLNDCETLMFIQGYTKVCIEQLLQPQFILFRAQIFDQLRSMSQQSHEDTSCKESSVLLRFRFDRIQLVQAVSEALDGTAKHDGKQHETSSERLLMLYLWSLNCLLDVPCQDSKRTAIDVRFRSCGSSVALFPSLNQAEVASVPDYLSFEGLNVLPPEGSSIVIKPHYHANLSQKLDGPHLQVCYHIESNHPWLYWDQETRAFRGHVPRFSRSQDVQAECGQVSRLISHYSYPVIHLLRIEVKAIAVFGYAGSKVRLERTIREKITLRVLPPQSDKPGADVPIRSLQPEYQCQTPMGIEAHTALEVQNGKGGSSDLTKREQDMKCDRDSGYYSDVANSNSSCSRNSSVNYRELTSIKLYPHSHQSDSSNSAPDCPESDESWEEPIITARKYNEEAEYLDSRYTPRVWQKRDDPYRWIDASVSPKTLKRGKASDSAVMQQAVSHQPPVQPPDSSKSHPLVHATDRSEFSSQVEDEENTSKGEFKDTLQLDFPIKRGKAHKSFSSKVRESSPKRLKGSRNDLGTRYLKPPLGENPNLASCKYQRMKRAAQASVPQVAEEETALVEPVKFSNRFAALQDLSDESSSISSIGDRAGLPTPPPSRSVSAYSNPDRRRPPLLRLAPGRFTGNTQSTESNCSYAASIPLPPSPTKPDDDQEGGFDEQALEDYFALRKVLGSGQAIEAYRQPGLSQVEKGQLLDAMKRSVGRGSSGSNSLLTTEDYEWMGESCSEDLKNEDMDSENRDWESDDDEQHEEGNDKEVLGSEIDYELWAARLGRSGRLVRDR